MQIGRCHILTEHFFVLSTVPSLLIFELLFSLLYDILCVSCFLLCMVVLYVTVLLLVGVTMDDDDTIRYDTRCYFNVRSRANMSQLNLPHGTDN